MHCTFTERLSCGQVRDIGERGAVEDHERGVLRRLNAKPGEGVPERYWNIGIRIEDDAVVTESGCELISRGVPVAAAEIEALMRS